jgi:hypothetical protein
MSVVRTVIRREYVQRVRSRWFFFATVLVPLLLLLATGVGVAAMGGDDPAGPLRAVAASDEDPVVADDVEPASVTGKPTRHKAKQHGSAAKDDDDTSTDDSKDTPTKGHKKPHRATHGHRRPTHHGGAHGTSGTNPRPGSGATPTTGTGGASTDTGTTTGTSVDPAPSTPQPQPQQPDPTPPPAPTPANLVANSVSYVGGGFQVSVSNTGETAAGSFTVRVSLGGRQAYYGSSGGIGAGGSTTVSIHTPCLEGTFSFTATVDVYGAVSESNEGDNTASGSTSALC